MYVYIHGRRGNLTIAMDNHVWLTHRHNRRYGNAYALYPNLEALSFLGHVISSLGMSRPLYGKMDHMHTGAGMDREKARLGFV